MRTRRKPRRFTGAHFARGLALATAAGALTGLCRRLRLRGAVRSERLTDVVAFLELPARAAADEALVRPRVDQLALARATLRRRLLRHREPPFRKPLSSDYNNRGQEYGAHARIKNGQNS